MVGDLVRANRRRLGLSQEDLAHRAGVSVRGIRKIEARQTGTPRPATVRLLADAFGLVGAERERFFQAALTMGETTQAVAERLVGRDGELATLGGHASAAREGGFRLVWVGGEAGAGKSALTRALTSTLAGQGWRTALGRSPEVDGAPSAWAWADVVRALLSGGEPVPDRVLTERLRPLISDEGPVVAPFWAARAVVDLLRLHAGLRPLLVVLDDVHRAGEETLQILRYAATELADRPVLVVATLRPTEIGPALNATRAALTGPRSDRVDLAGLAEPDVALLLGEHLSTVVAPEVVRLIVTRTQGNPLFVGETARLIAGKGFAAATELVPPGVGDVLRRRLAGLSPAARAALRTVAVFGIEVEVEVLLSVDPAGADVTLEGLEAAVRAGLLTEPAPGSVRFSHVLVRDTIYHDLPRLRRADLHTRVLNTLVRVRPHGVSALAHHALAAAGPATARSAAARGAQAGRLALDACAYGEAIVLLSGALDVLGEEAGDDAVRLDLLCMLVSAQAHAGDVRCALRSRALAIRLAHRLGDRHSLTRAYTAYDAPTLWTTREYRERNQELVAGLTATLAMVPPGDPVARCLLLATLAPEIEATDPRRTDEASAAAVEIADRLDDPVLLCRALNARYRYVATLGPDRWCELDDIGKRQLDVAVAHGLTAYRTQAHHILCMAKLGQNDLDGAQWHLDRAAEHATSGQLGLALAIIGMFRGLRELIAGRVDEAEAAYAPVIADLRHLGSPGVDEMDLLIRFCVERVRPEPGVRERMAALAELARPAHELFGDAVAEPYARLLIAAGRTEQARAVWNPGVAIPRDHYWFRWTALRAENAVQLGDLLTAAVCYWQLLPWRGHLPGLLHAHLTLGPVDHTLGDLAAALGSPSVAAGHYADAMVVAERLGAAHWASRARIARDGAHDAARYDARRG
ncbi:ATP-binding protein [Actinoplanes sp. GCM10030250]|uniref:ATP-binding protein n=1 Tax=Actinoplanes sp. GCM10030250 TaxID=3273376 RepID=UPI003610CE9B